MFPNDDNYCQCPLHTCDDQGLSTQFDMYTQIYNDNDAGIESNIIDLDSFDNNNIQHPAFIPSSVHNYQNFPTLPSVPNYFQDSVHLPHTTGTIT
ncbi:unnamed protein product [Rotaria sp. Silwood2]|nr:unnamed protein product [Rotaria sp. Silwood2]CAF3283245.1 unnamed protein product [Rotaria sp. Silwood2]CAF4040378.1 unnamed protein product [Rotaria sp. Silwood2]CAF4285097.1 unnamed protein product [Rotaria sp. Silwood2]